MKTGNQSKMFVVLFDDQQGICVPMSWDNDCEGAIYGGCGERDRIALFPSRSEARKAINITAKFAALNKAQGKIANEDFLGDCRKYIRVAECQQRKQEAAK